MSCMLWRNRNGLAASGPLVDIALYICHPMIMSNGYVKILRRPPPYLELISRRKASVVVRLWGSTMLGANAVTLLEELPAPARDWLMPPSISELLDFHSLNNSSHCSCDLEE
jgi:hypothetical protein